MKETDLKKEAREKSKDYAETGLIPEGMLLLEDCDNFIDKAILSERKRCAEIAKNLGFPPPSDKGSTWTNESNWKTGEDIATAIDKDV